MAVGAKRADPLGERHVFDQVALAGQGFHAAVHMAGGQLYVTHGFAFYGQAEVDGFL